MSSIKENRVASEYLEHLLTGNRANCSALAKEYLARNPSLKNLYEEVFKTALYEVGVLWEKNRISVATEHMATAITEGILNELYADIHPLEKSTYKAVLTVVEAEQHQVGVKMVADIFELHGWESYFLGTGVPTSELIRYLGEAKPNVLGISLSIYFNYANLLNMMEKIRKHFPDLDIIVGGQAFQHGHRDLGESFPNLWILPDLSSLEQFIADYPLKR